MKAIYIPIVAAVAGLIIYNCTGEKETHVKNEKPVTVPTVMTVESIFNADSIKLAMDKANNLQKSESRKSFLQGLDLLANKNKPLESIEFFKQSICYYPDEKNYLYLFKASIETSDTTSAIKINKLLSDLNELWKTEYYEIDFNDALIAAVKKDTAGCIESLSAAMMDGFVFKDRIVNEKLFAFMDNSLNFQSFVAGNFGSDEKLNKLIFKSFVKYYPDLALPYEMNKDSVSLFNYDRYIDYNFATLIPGMNDGRFSRDVTNEYMYVGKIKVEAGYAFIYKSFMAIADTLNPVKTYVVTYDTIGKMIENEMIGCMCSPTESMGFIINKDLSINITNYKTTWEFDPLDKGYAGNKVTGFVEDGKSTIVIDKNGTLVREGVAGATGTVTKAGG